MVDNEPSLTGYVSLLGGTVSLVVILAHSLGRQRQPLGGTVGEVLAHVADRHLEYRRMAIVAKDLLDSVHGSVGNGRPL